NADKWRTRRSTGGRGAPRADAEGGAANSTDRTRERIGSDSQPRWVRCWDLLVITVSVWVTLPTCSISNFPSDELQVVSGTEAMARIGGGLGLPKGWTAVETGLPARPSEAQMGGT